MKQSRLQFNNLHNLLPTQESRIKLSKTINIQFSKINKWLDPDSRLTLKADAIILMIKYFDCSVDYLLNLTNRIR